MGEEGRKLSDTKRVKLNVLEENKRRYQLRKRKVFLGGGIAPG